VARLQAATGTAQEVDEEDEVDGKAGDVADPDPSDGKTFSTV
jgi:hypothetical protein